MKASERPARQKDIAHRRCPDCRNRRLADLGMDLVWCDGCGKTDVSSMFPYQKYWQDHLDYMAVRRAARGEQ